MRLPMWVEPAIWGAVVGGLATVVVGFDLGGWMLPSGADRMAKQAVTQALVPVCVNQSKHDSEKLKELSAIGYSYARQEFVAKSGWATMPGTEKPNPDLAEACANVLAKANET